MARPPTSGRAPGKRVETLQHDEARRKNIRTAEYQSVLEKQKAGAGARELPAR